MATERVWRCYDKEMGRNEWTSDEDLMSIRRQSGEWMITEFVAIVVLAPSVAFDRVPAVPDDAAMRDLEDERRELTLRLQSARIRIETLETELAALRDGGKSDG